eukprot:jgi/Psemu1/325247/estExt_fgenesh1_pg.C_2170003
MAREGWLAQIQATDSIPLSESAPCDSESNEPTATTVSKKQRKRLAKRERAQRLKLERKQREKDQRRAAALREGRDIEAEQRFAAERTASGDRRQRLDEIWAAKREEAETEGRFRICIDLGSRSGSRSRGRGRCRRCEPPGARRREDDAETSDGSNLDECELTSFESVMREREIASLAQQIRYCYSYNRKSPNPVLVSVTGLTSGQTSVVRGFPSVHQILERETGFCEWKRRMFDCTDDTLEDYYGLANTASTTSTAGDGEASAQPQPQPRIVYLTSDSQHMLHHLEEDTVYVLGGIVDRNRLKGATLRRATEELSGVQTARLPLEEYLRENNLTMSTTKVLTVNHVFDILLRCHQHGGDWGAAFREVLPSRKSVK